MLEFGIAAKRQDHLGTFVLILLNPGCQEDLAGRLLLQNRSFLKVEICRKMQANRHYRTPIFDYDSNLSKRP